MYLQPPQQERKISYPWLSLVWLSFVKVLEVKKPIQKETSFVWERDVPFWFTFTCFSLLGVCSSLWASSLQNTSGKDGAAGVVYRADASPERQTSVSLPLGEGRKAQGAGGKVPSAFGGTGLQHPGLGGLNQTGRHALALGESSFCAGPEAGE